MTTLTSSGKILLTDFIKETFDSKKIPGAVVGISNVDGEIYFQAGGTNISGDSTSGEINPDSIFWICSQTKMITAVAALILIEQGKISLDTPVSDYLSEFQHPVVVDDVAAHELTFRPANTAVTVKHLLNFSSGLFYPVKREGYDGVTEVYSSKEMHASTDPLASFFQIIMGELPGLRLKFEPGTDFAYGFSSDALGFIIEKVSGQSLHNFCKQHIFDPLGMETSSFYLTPDLKKRLVGLNVREKDGSLSPWTDRSSIMEQDPNKVRLNLGGVGMFSSMRDYLKILRHLMQIYVCRPMAHSILKKATVDQIFTPALTDEGSKTLSGFFGSPGLQWGAAMAICTQDIPNGRRKGSAFWGGWAGTIHFIDPTMGIAVVFGTQIGPYGDVELVNAFKKLESLIYSAVDHRVQKS